MASGEIKMFTAAKPLVWTGVFDPAVATFKLAICDNTTTPTIATATPNISDFTQVGTAGNYVSGGTLLEGCSITLIDGVYSFDSTTNPTWAAHASNDLDAFWGIIYKIADGSALAYIDLAGPISMRDYPLTITWPSTGIIALA